MCGCSVNYENILITGKVIDSVTRKPVVGAVVIGDCMFYDSEIVDYDFDGDTVLTDREGKFKLIFGKGVVIDLQVSAPGYSRKKNQFTLTSNKESIKIELDAEEYSTGRRLSDSDPTTSCVAPCSVSILSNPLLVLFHQQVIFFTATILDWKPLLNNARYKQIILMFVGEITPTKGKKPIE